MKVLDLFSGIGGFSLGLERAGMETVAFCEFDKHARKVLNKHWPNVPVYEDVRELTNERLKSDGITGIDVITGGFPCQDISVAGKQAGIGEGTRSGLWSECARLVREIRPNYAIFENVTALLSGEQGRWFQRVLFDLSQIGYDAEWHCIPASELGAHHHRDRVWIIAYPAHYGCRSGAHSEQTGAADEQSGNHDLWRKSIGFSESPKDGKNVADPSSQSANRHTFRKEKEHSLPRVCGNNKNVAHTRSGRQPRQGESINAIYSAPKTIGEAIELGNGSTSDIWRTEPELGRVANGVPNRSHRLKQLGNSVVPQIPELIGRAIMADQWGEL
jgi:DNA (cytosine-5)-methyltransferase 1